MSMQLQPTPNKTPNAVRPGPLKRDINLLPANEASEKLARRGTIALAVLVGVLIVSYFAIAMPAFALNKLQGLVTASENQAKLLAPAEADAMAKAAQRDRLAQILAFAKDAGSGYAQPADITASLEKACPGTVTLSSFTLDASGLAVSGFTDDDRAVAEFIVNLKTAFPQYPVVTLVSAGDAEGDKSRWKRQFQVTALAAAPEASGSSAPEATKGGDRQ